MKNATSVARQSDYGGRHWNGRFALGVLRGADQVQVDAKNVLASGNKGDRINGAVRQL